jgi:hypothetical protein
VGPPVAHLKLMRMHIALGVAIEEASEQAASRSLGLTDEDERLIHPGDVLAPQTERSLQIADRGRPLREGPLAPSSARQRGDFEADSRSRARLFFALAAARASLSGFLSCISRAGLAPCSLAG